MTISSYVAYRVYSLASGKNAILFHIRKREYMFLDGLSAELFDLLLSSDQLALESWAAMHQLAPADIHEFSALIQAFDHFDNGSCAKTSDYALNDDSPDNKYSLNLFQNKLRENGLFYSFHIDLTNRCNERCIHCYHPFQSYNYSSELSLKEVKELVDIIYDLGVFSVTLSGGESLLRKDFFDILEYISKKGLLTVLFTNGMLLTEATVQKLLEYRLNMVSISLYGDSAEVHDAITSTPGSFQKTMMGINLLRKHNIQFELKCVVLAENADRTEAMRALSKKLNNGRDCKLDFSLCGKVDGDCSVYSHKVPIEKLAEIFYSDPERFISKPEQLRRSVDEMPCAAGKYSLYCSADGSIYPCVSFRLFLCNYKGLPNIRSNKILEKWLRTTISNFSECFKHDYCNYCTEQCAGNNLIENNDYLNSDISHCERAKVIATWYSMYGSKL